MFYRFSLTVPANTLASSPSELSMQLAPGVIHRVEVSFPPGAAALTHVRILQGIHQVWPTNPDGWFAWDDYTLSWPDEYEDLEPPYTLTLQAYNEDDAFSHQVVVRFALRPKRQDSALAALRRFIVP